MNVWVFPWAPSFSRVARQIYYILSSRQYLDLDLAGFFRVWYLWDVVCHSKSFSKSHWPTWNRTVHTMLPQKTYCSVTVQCTPSLLKNLSFFLLYLNTGWIAEILNSGCESYPRVTSGSGMIWRVGSAPDLECFDACLWIRNCYFLYSGSDSEQDLHPDPT